MKRFVLSLVVLLSAWMWSRGARDPRQWPKRLPKEIAEFRADLNDALAAGRRASAQHQRQFDDELARAQSH